MSSARAVLRTLVLGFALLGNGGCARGFVLKDPPSGFTKTESWKGTHGSSYGSVLRMRAPDGVTLVVLAMWPWEPLDRVAEQVVERYVESGGVLVAQSAVESGNGVPGIRLDFDHVPFEGDNERWSLTTIVFVTREWDVRIMLRGRHGQLDRHQQDIDRVLAGIEIY